jgi:hypothetical protein
MNIAVFADVHGRILLAFKLCARWQKETGEQIDLILQAGDLGTFPVEARMDKATRSYIERDPTERGFLDHFTTPQPEVKAVLSQTKCNLVYVRGNHEDHTWLDNLENRTSAPTFPVDPYQRVYCLKTGVPYTFQSGEESVHILGIGRIGAPAFSKKDKESNIQPHERKRLDRLGDIRVDILLTHDADRHQVFEGAGIEEIGLMIALHQPRYHFFGHYNGPLLHTTDANAVTQVYKLADLAWDRRDRGLALEPGSMGILRWKSRKEHSFEVIDAPWYRQYTASTWKYF